MCVCVCIYVKRRWEDHLRIKIENEKIEKSANYALIELSRSCVEREAHKHIYTTHAHARTRKHKIYWMHKYLRGSELAR